MASHADEIKKMPPSPEDISFDPKVCTEVEKVEKREEHRLKKEIARLKDRK